MRAVIFDFDQVIVRSAEKHLKAFLITFKKHGYKVRKEKILKRFGKTADQILKEIFPDWNKRKVEKFLKEKEGAYREIIEKEGIRTIKGVKNLIKSLVKKKVKIAICSASFRRNIIIPLQRTSLRKYFKIIVSAESVKKHKPNPDPLLKTAKLLKEKPENCIYIGDSIYEMQAAKRAKMLAIGILTGFYSERELKENGANYVCRNWNEVQRLLAKLV
jgi:pyrophosphatase PpaX